MTPEPADMSTFESQFTQVDLYSKRMTNDDYERLAFLNQRIQDIIDVTVFRDGQNAEIQVAQADINESLQLVRQLEKLLLRKRMPLDQQMAANDQGIRVDRRQREKLERERIRLIAEIEARERFLKQHELLRKSTATKPWAVGLPDGKKALPHQIEGAQRLVSSESGLLGDKPGLGKTLQAIMIIDMLRAIGKGKKVLVFTPKSVVRDFERAFQKWTDPTFIHVLDQKITGIKAPILESLKHFPEAVVITNYEVWRKDRSIHQKMMEVGFDTVILDEAHVLKETTSKAYSDVLEIIYAENCCPKCGHASFVNRGPNRLCRSCEYVQEKTGDFCSVKHVFPMSGTFVLNRPGDLFPPLHMIDREAFPTKSDFLADYCKKEYDYNRHKWHYTFGAGGSERLLKKLGSRYVARTRESAGVIMPPQEVRHHWLELDPEKYRRQFDFIKALNERARLAFSKEDQMTVNETIAWYTRIRQASSWPDGIQIKGCPHEPMCEDEFGMPDVKACFKTDIIFPPKDAPPIGESILMDETESIVLDAVNEGDRVLVFSHFRKSLEEIGRRLEVAGIPYGRIVGGLKDSERQKYIDDFNTNYTRIGKHKYEVLLCQYKSAAVGLNLNGAQQSVMLEREWNPGKEEQAMDRLRRIDSETDSIVHLLHCPGTATDLIDQLHEMKKAMIEGFEADVNLQEAMRKFLEG